MADKYEAEDAAREIYVETANGIRFVTVRDG